MSTKTVTKKSVNKVIAKKSVVKKPLAKKPIAKKAMPKKMVKKNKPVEQRPTLLDIEVTMKKADGTKEVRTYKDAKALAGFVVTDAGIEFAGAGSNSYFLPLMAQLDELTQLVRGSIARAEIEKAMNYVSGKKRVS